MSQARRPDIRSELARFLRLILIRPRPGPIGRGTMATSLRWAHNAVPGFFFFKTYFSSPRKLPWTPSLRSAACAAPRCLCRDAFAATPAPRPTPAPPRLTPRRRALPRARVSASSAALRSTRRAQARRSNGGQPRRPREATPRWHFFLGVGFPVVNWGSIRYLFAAANQAIVSPRSHPACAG